MAHGFANDTTFDVAMWAIGAYKDPMPFSLDTLRSHYDRGGVDGIAALLVGELQWLITKTDGIARTICENTLPSIDMHEVACFVYGFMRANAGRPRFPWINEAERVYLAEVIAKETENISQPKIQRIKLLRKWHQMGLKDAKEAVEEMFYDNGHGVPKELSCEQGIPQE